MTVQSSIAGQQTSCYRVAAQVGDDIIYGYLEQSAFTDLTQFEAARRDAWHIGSSAPGRASADPSSKSASPETESVASQLNLSGQVEPEAAAAMTEAVQLMQNGQPSRALAVMERQLSLVRSGKTPEPVLLTVAGLAAWRADRSKQALQYWDQSMALRPDATLGKLAASVRQEAESDQSGQRLIGSRVVLRYEGANIPASTARQMVQVVDQEVARVSTILGCNNRERLPAVAQTRAAYMATTNAPEWSGGVYDGRAIRVPITEGALDAQTRETLAHETVHACLRMLGDWPQWLDEGLAQSISGRTLSVSERAGLSELSRKGQMPTLSQLAGGWSRLDADSARVAYAVGLRAVEIFDEIGYGVRNLMQNPGQLENITAEIDRRLQKP